MSYAGRQHRTQRAWVLVVDDEPIAARATARSLSGVGVSVSIARDVDAALLLVSRAATPPAAVVLDFDLGSTDGVRALWSLRATGCEAPCAFYTGSPERALSALRAKQLEEDHDVFQKSQSDGALAEWLAGVLSAGGDAHRSGLRRKVF